MGAAHVLGDVAIGVAVAVLYLAAWVAWLTLGIFPFVLAGLLYLGVRYGLPAVFSAWQATAQRGWGTLRHAVRQLAPRHAAPF